MTPAPDDAVLPAGSSAGEAGPPPCPGPSSPRPRKPPLGGGAVATDKPIGRAPPRRAGTAGTPPGRGRFLRFLAAGGASAALNLSARWLLGQAGVGYGLSVALAYGVGVVSAFALMRLFVFEAAAGGGAARAQFARFVLVNLVGFATVWAVSVGLARGVFPTLGFRWQHADTLAHALGIAALALTSYQGHRLFSFRS